MTKPISIYICLLYANDYVMQLVWQMGSKILNLNAMDNAN